MWSKHCIVVALIAGLGAAVAAQVESVGDRLHKGIYQEETVGDLDAAMKIYQEIVADEKANRPHAAQAKYRLGMCYMKRGQKPQAVGAFQQLVEQFPDQTDLIAQARARLAELGQVSAAMVARRLWDSPESWFNGAPSPDGKYVSYTDWNTGSLAVHEFATGENRVLAKGSWDEGETTYGSIFSPDGKQLAYVWSKDDGYELRIIELAGAEPRLVYRDELRHISPADWSADGKHILVLLAGRSPGEIAVVAVDDGSVRVLKTPKGRARKQMRFSPDGRYIAYSERPEADTQQHDIYLLAVDGTSDTPLVEHPADDFVLGWAPDGRRLVFASKRIGPMGVLTLEVADGKPQGEPQVVDLQIGPFSPLGLTRDGSLYYNLYSGWAGVLVAELDTETGKVVKSPARAFQEFESSNYWAPDWSADGRYLVSRSERPEVGTVLCVRDMQTENVRVLTPAEKNVDMHVLRWSPDGRSLLGVRSAAGLIQIDAQTGDVKTLTEAGHQPVWAPDGNAVFYVNPKYRRIVRRHLVTGEEKELYRSTGDGTARGLTGLAFSRLDKNNDGKLTKDEVNRAPEHIRKRVEVATASGDGIITREEFSKLVAFLRHRGIRHLDVSRDGRRLAF